MQGDTETYVYIYNGVAEVPKDVTHVRVESDVTIIPAYAFMDCRDMEEIELPEGLIKIEEHEKRLQKLANSFNLLRNLYIFVV